MTAIPQKTAGLTPSGQSTSATTQATAIASHTPSPPVSGTSSPLTPAPASSVGHRSYASATKQFAAPADASVTRPGSTQQQQHGKLASVSPVSDSTNNSMQNNQPSGVTIVNGAHAQQQPPPPPLPVSSASSAHGDHSRKPSVTITSAGTTGYMPNGGGPAGRPTNLQFGFTNPQSSPNMGNPAVLAGQAQPGLGVAAATNPRITSPQTSPSPIPQPASSGGRPPPSSYQAQGNGPNFGSFGDVGDASMRPNLHGPLGPGSQTSHLRRESTQSTHSDMSSHMGSGPAGPGRGGYPHQGGRGRGYSQSGYQGQMPYSSPGPNFRSTPNQPRGGHNMGAQFHGHAQGRPLPFPNSPHQANRSPALANAHPTTPQMNPVPMAHAQMPPQHYGAYGQHMGPQPGYAHAYDPNYGYYNPAYGMQQMQFMTPPSPQPRPGLPYNAPGPYMQNQYPVQPPPQAQPLSRTPSQLSSTDRPASSLGQIPSTGAPSSTHAHTSSRASNSPVPSKTHFVIPPTKRAAIVIKDPSGAVKTFDKAATPASPARATPSPVKLSTPTATPPPQPPSSADSSRTETARVKTDEDVKRELRAAVMQRIEQEEAERRRKEQEEEAARRKKDEEEDAAAAAAAAVTTKQDDGDKAIAEEKAPEPVEKAMENLSLEEEPSKAAEAAPAAEEPTKADAVAAAPAPAPAAAAAAAAAADDEIDYDAIERELAEIEAKEAAAEAEYQRKKQAQKEEQERKEREEREAWEANMKKAEREAEALEEARLKKQEAGEDEAARKEREELFASLKKGDAGTPATESPVAHTPADSGAVTPVSTSDVSMGPPARPVSGAKREKPAPLSLETTKAVEPPQPSAAMKALQSARFVDDLSKISYPPSIVSPNPALNANAPADRKFHYNKEFLLQFQGVFKEKPSIDWDARVRETVGDSDSARPQSARTPSMAGGRTSSRPGIPQNFQVMGTFGQMGAGGRTLPPGTTSEARFNMSNAGARTPSMGSGLGSFGRPGSMVGAPGMVRTGSAGGMHPGMPQAPRVGSGSRGGARTGSKQHKQTKGKEEETNKSMPLTAGKEVKALQVSTTGWKPRSVGQAAAVAGPAPGGDGHMPPDVVQRKVKAALNKMTPENFDRISGQILDIVSQSKDESDGRTLRQVIQLTFEKATDEAHWAPMYAKFAKRMLESMSPEIKDENIRDKMGNVVTGGSLFRKYLLNRCQEEFERGWKINLPPKPEGETEEVAMMSDEYYAAAAAKRRGLGLVKFIGELYKLGMLTERIMHECVKKLVDYEGIPDEAEVESLTSLLRTIGGSLDASEKGHAMMDAYFARISMMIDTAGLPSRLRFMLMDIVDLRAAHWRSKDADKGPKTIHEIREEAARQQQEAEMERLRQQASRGGRLPMGRGDARSFSGGYPNAPPPQDFASSKVGTDDLRRLRTSRNTTQPMSFGPSSMLGSRSSSGRKNLGPGGNLVRGSDDSAASSRNGASTPKKDDKESASSANAFSALASLEDRDNMATSPPSNPTSPELTRSQPAVERRPSQAPPSTADNSGGGGGGGGGGSSSGNTEETA